MKTLFIEARYKGKINLSGLDAWRIPKHIRKITLFTTVQYLDYLPEIKKYIESEGKKVILLKPRNALYEGQILGCSIAGFNDNNSKDNNSVDINKINHAEKQRDSAFLYIGDGLFHPIALALKNKETTFTYNPFSGVFSEIDNTQIARFEKQKKAAQVKFYSAKNIGILVSTKKGQSNIKAADILKKKFPNKKFHILAFDTLDFTQLENFTFIDCFVNTSCPRIAYDDYEKFQKPILDFGEII